jgi:hypothetical protein
MEYICRHCKADLDEGDILEHFLIKYKDYKKAREIAGLYGWTETNKIHFNRSILMQPKKASQYTMCPDCEKLDPLTAKR